MDISVSEQNRRTHSSGSMSPSSSFPSPSSGSTPVPFLPAADSPSTRAALRVFVSIVSYRDPETWPTLRSLYAAATHPHRVFAGVVWQYDPAEDGGFVYPPAEAASPVLSANVRQLFVAHTAARGPMYARHLCRRLYRGQQQLFLQLDSHMRFTPGWDVQLIDQLYRASACSSHPQRRALLTGYPSGYHVDDAKDKAEARASAPSPPVSPSTNVMAASHFASDGLLRIRAVPLPPPPSPSPLSPAAPLPALFVSAGFLFTSAAFLALPAVPPESFPYLFFGEELLLSLQAFSHGFDAFHTAPHVAVHCWERGYRRGWREVVGPEGEGEAEGKRRLRRIMLGEEDAGEWLGDVRSVRDYWQWAGVDWARGAISERAKTGGVDAAQPGRPPSAGAAGDTALPDAVLQRVMAFAKPAAPGARIDGFG